MSSKRTASLFAKYILVLVAVLGLIVVSGCSSSPTAPTSVAQTDPNSAPAGSPASSSTTMAIVSSLSPSTLTDTGTVQVVTIEGSNFKDGLTVAVSQPDQDTITIAGSQIENLTPTSFQIAVTPGGTGTYTVQVRNPATSPSPPVTLAVAPPDGTQAVISGVSPGSPTASANAQFLYVLGSSFQSGLSATLTVPDGSVKTVTGAAILFGLPTAFKMYVTLDQPGAYALRVTNPLSDASEPFRFTVKGNEPPPSAPVPPTIAGTTPSAPIAAATAQGVYVFGTGFEPGVTAVLGKPDGSLVPVTGTAILGSSATAFKMNVVLDVAGTYKLRAINPSGLSSDWFSFTVNAPPPPPTPVAPAITSVAPTSLSANTSAQGVYVLGTAFETGVTAQLTRPNGAVSSISGTAIQGSSPTAFRMNVVLDVAGTYKVKATNPSGLASDWFTFTVGAPAPPPAPTVTSVYPTTITANTAAQVMYVLGTGFDSGVTAQITRPNGSVSTITGSAITINSTTNVRLSVVLDVAGTYKVKAVNASGLASDWFTFTVNAPPPPPVPATPAITSVSPASPTVNAAAQGVYVLGTGFETGVTAQLTRPDGSVVPVTGSAILGSSATAFKMNVVLDVVGTYKVKAVNVSGLVSDWFTFSVSAPAPPPAPTVTTVYPTTITASATSQGVYVIGTNFETGVTALLTRPNGTVQTISGASIVGSSATAFKMMVTLDVAGTYKVQAINPSGQTSSLLSFTVN